MERRCSGAEVQGAEVRGGGRAGWDGSAGGGGVAGKVTGLIGKFVLLSI